MDRDAVVERLHRAADWTDADIECPECDSGRGCDLHAGDRADIRRWRRLAVLIATSPNDHA